MNEPLGEYGGVVTRKVILFGEEHAVGRELKPELLEGVSVRHRMALKGAGLVKYYSEPEGVAAGLVSVKPTVAVTSNKPKTRKTTPSKSKTSRG